MAEQPKPDPQTLFQNMFKMDKYRDALANLKVKGTSVVEVAFEDIVQTDRELAHHLLLRPAEYLNHAGKGALDQLQIEDIEYWEKTQKITVRVHSLFNTTPLRKIGASDLGKLLMVNGIVIKASFSRPRIIKAAYRCKRCGTVSLINQTESSSNFLKKPYECQAPDCGRDGPFEFVEDECEMIDEQEIWIQEKPDELPPGQMPRTLHLKLHEDLVDVARPGDIIDVVGVVKSMPKRVKGATLNTMDIFLEVNSIKSVGKEPETISTSEEQQVLDLARDKNITLKVQNSIAPSIHGNNHIKEAVMYLLFGGVPKERSDIKIRGEMNILLIGDPGTAKSQLLRYVARLAPRGLFTSGKGNTGVGLTACVTKDAETQGYILEAGALVLADKGIACIDEIDKMHDSDRETIHETLEQHTVSIAKGGIIATLNARCAVLAAANPLMGRYNKYASIVENISLPVTLLSRFDLIFLMMDTPELQRDTELSSHILDLHAGSAPAPEIEPELLRKYIAYAKTIKPVLSKEAMSKIQAFYLKMRKASTAEGAPLAIGARQLEALVRLSEARARSGLRDVVTAEDASAAIAITMKSLGEVGIDVSTGKIDIDVLMTGKPKSVQNRVNMVMRVISEMSSSSGIGMVKADELFGKLDAEGICEDDAQRFVRDLLKRGAIFEPREGYYKKT